MSRLVFIYSSPVSTHARALPLNITGIGKCSGHETLAQPVRKPSSFVERDADAQGRQSPCASQCRTVFRAQPSSAAIRFDPHPNDFSRSIAETSSGVFIMSLR